MPQQKTLSIIVPLYDVELYIDECVRSIVKSAEGSRRATEIEIVFVDDASPDDSLASAVRAMDGSALGFKQVRHTTNLGVGASRRSGWKSATGEFVWFIDPDDKIAENAIQTVLTKTALLPNMCIAEFPIVNHITDSSDALGAHYMVGAPPADPLLKAIDHDIVPTSTYGEQLLLRRVPGVLWTKVFRRSEYDDALISTDRQSEDIQTVFAMLTQQPSVFLFSDTIYSYRQRNTSMTKKSGYQRESLNAYARCISLAESSDWYTDALRPALMFFEISRLAISELQRQAAERNVTGFRKNLRNVRKKIDRGTRQKLLSRDYLGTGRTWDQVRLIAAPSWSIKFVETALYVYWRRRHRAST